MAHHRTVTTTERTHHVIVEPTEDGRFLAACPKSPQFVALGASEDEALRSLKDALNAACSHSNRQDRT